MSETPRTRVVLPEMIRHGDVQPTEVFPQPEKFGEGVGVHYLVPHPAVTYALIVLLLETARSPDTQKLIQELRGLLPYPEYPSRKP